MKIALMNYDAKKVTVDVGDNVATIIIDVVSGDEIANVTYKDYTRKSFDSAEYLHNLRLADFNDDSYEVYNFQNKDNLINNPLWENRKSSYDSRWREEE